MKFDVTVVARTSAPKSVIIREIEADSIEDAESKAYEMYDSLYWFVEHVARVIHHG